MPLNWIDLSKVSFNTLLLLERVQISWWAQRKSGWPELALALRAHSHVEWFLRHKCPEITPWLDGILAQAPSELPEPDAIRQAELQVLQAIEDWIVYAIDPGLYDAQPFTQWDNQELYGVVDFKGKTVIDIGAGTGRLSLAALEGGAELVYAVEPVENLRHFILHKARQAGYTNLYAVDGTITAVPFSSSFADVVLAGHVFGDFPEQELAEMERVTRPGGQITLFPATCDDDSELHRRDHRFLVERGYEWQVFIEPPADRVRKYWKVTPA